MKYENTYLNILTHSKCTEILKIYHLITSIPSDLLLVVGAGKTLNALGVLSNYYGICSYTFHYTLSVFLHRFI